MSDVWKLYSRESGELVQEFNVAGKSDRAKERIFDGMVMKIDFERFWLDRSGDDE